MTAFPSLSIDMYLPAFPSLQDYFHTSAGAVQRTLAIFFIGLSLGQLFFGPLSDRFGRKAPLVVGILVYIAGALGAILAPNIGFLTAARLVQAIGGCAAVVIARAMVRDLFHERESARVFSLLMLVMGLAPILAPMLGSEVLILLGWQGIFAVLAGFALLCLAAVLFGLAETLPATGRERRGIGRTFAIYRSLLADRAFLGHALAAALISGGMFAYITGSPFVFIKLHGVSPRAYGFLFGLNAFGLIASSQINRALLKRHSDRLLLKRALRVNLAAVLVLAVDGVFGLGGLAGLMGPLFVAMSSMGFISPNAIAAAMGRSAGHAGSASALIGGLQFAAAAASGATVSALQNGTALPMCGVILTLSACAFVIHAGLAEARDRGISASAS